MHCTAVAATRLELTWHLGTEEEKDSRLVGKRSFNIIVYSTVLCCENSINSAVSVSYSILAGGVPFSHDCTAKLS